jgi:sphingomyelin phosphodiesterase 2
MRILTLNTWCPPYAKHIPMRALAIADEIRVIAPQLVCLQEMYLSAPRLALIAQTAGILPHWHYFASGLVGSGLLTLSTYPILRTAFLPFRLRGKPEKIHHGDYYAAKGIGLTVIDTPDGVLNVFNTHTHAQYHPSPDDEYRFYNHSNLLEAALFVRHYAQPGCPRILCGDLNTLPTELGYRIITHLTGLEDLWLAQHPQAPGYTYASANPYSNEHDQRLDYILADAIRVSAIRIGFTESPGAISALAYSDHYGLIADFDLTPESGSLVPQFSDRQIRTALTELHEEAVIELKLAANSRRRALTMSALSVLSLFDAVGTLRPFVRHFGRPARLLRSMISLLIVLYGVGNLFHFWLNLGAREQVIRQFRDELAYYLTDQET